MYNWNITELMWKKENEIALFTQIKKIKNSNKLLQNIHFSMIYNTYRIVWLFLTYYFLLEKDKIQNFLF